jgi:hypothetical protein
MSKRKRDEPFGFFVCGWLVERTRVGFPKFVLPQWYTGRLLPGWS